MTRRYYVLFGFEKENDSNTGFLKIGQPGESLYSAVGDVSAATRFPEDGIARAWEFLSSEPGLSKWKFHPVPMVEPAEAKEKT